MTEDKMLEVKTNMPIILSNLHLTSSAQMSPSFSIYSSKSIKISNITYYDNRDLKGCNDIVDTLILSSWMNLFANEVLITNVKVETKNNLVPCS